MIRGPNAVREKLAAAPFDIACKYVPRSSPAAWAYMSPSHIPIMFEHMVTWFPALVCCPHPAGPIWAIVPENVSRIGLTRSRTSCSPPTNTERVPFLAPTSPPLTGASRANFPAELAASDISTARDGSDVVISTMIPPLGRPVSTPFSELRITSRTSLGNPTIVKTTSLFSATALGESICFAPSSSSGCNLLLVLLYAEKSVNPLDKQCLAMLTPVHRKLSKEKRN
mmetsp:Transcript_26393/g.102880  ORF Transcript_26393/g.102880 Transcript_26393/m.102880 type:complete len:226 (-) Transcript_26393:226-903(-)